MDGYVKILGVGFFGWIKIGFYCNDSFGGITKGDESGGLWRITWYAAVVKGDITRSLAGHK